MAFIDTKERISQKLRRRFVARRMETFQRTFPRAACSAILDIGGTAAFWDKVRWPGKVVIVNMDRAHETSDRWVVVRADGCALPFADASFDIVFSNSLIEHVRDQAALAREILRVSAAGVWLQTPDRDFPIEMHAFFPLYQFLPRLLRRLVWRFWPFGHFEPGNEHFWEELERISLLSRAKLQNIFPDAIILRERFLLLSKALIALVKRG